MAAGGAGAATRAPCGQGAAPGSLQHQLPGDGEQAAAGCSSSVAGSAWEEVSAKLAALRVRAGCVAPGIAADGGEWGSSGGGAGDTLASLAAQAGTPQERLLVAKLVEASSIITSEREQAYKAALEAAAARRHVGSGGGGGSLLVPRP